MSIEAIQQVDSILERLQGRDCSACGAPNCRTFAEDVVKGEASVEVCFLLSTSLKETAEKDREEE
jgi:Na+-translocating ferredoxin:NAD+ oxidoreductase RNF subunit RnfB